MEVTYKGALRQAHLVSGLDGNVYSGPRETFGALNSDECLALSN
jgi:hypothetical protein